MANAPLLPPVAHARASALVEGVAVYAAGSLAATVGVLSAQPPGEPASAGIGALFARPNTCEVDFSDIRGQKFAKPALVVAEAGWHNVRTLQALLAMSKESLLTGVAPVSTVRSILRSM